MSLLLLKQIMVMILLNKTIILCCLKLVLMENIIILNDSFNWRIFVFKIFFIRIIEAFVDVLKILQLLNPLEAIFFSNCAFSNHIGFIFSRLQNIIFESNDLLFRSAHTVCGLNHNLILNFWRRFLLESFIAY